jgi:hypothetical protein
MATLYPLPVGDQRDSFFTYEQKNLGKQSMAWTEGVRTVHIYTRIANRFSSSPAGIAVCRCRCQTVYSPLCGMTRLLVVGCPNTKIITSSPSHILSRCSSLILGENRSINPCPNSPVIKSKKIKVRMELKKKSIEIIQSNKKEKVVAIWLFWWLIERQINST